MVQERGSRLPISANINWSPDVKLVYKDGERVQYIPGTTTTFILKEYKKDLGVAYQAIILYSLPYKDRSDSRVELDEIDKRLPYFL